MNRDEFYSNLDVVSGSLEHHGIKGQKWGVRRYQNEDGSYTPAGQKRYFKGGSFDKKRYGKDQAKYLTKADKIETKYAVKEWLSKTGSKAETRYAKVSEEGRKYKETYSKLASDNQISFNTKDRLASTNTARRRVANTLGTIGMVPVAALTGFAYVRVRGPQPYGYQKYTAKDELSDELKHFGILGMKWGIRRFQNKDGSWTKKGLERRNERDKSYDDYKTDENAANVKAKLGDDNYRVVSDFLDNVEPDGFGSYTSTVNMSGTEFTADGKDMNEFSKSVMDAMDMSKRFKEIEKDALTYVKDTVYDQYSKYTDGSVSKDDIKTLTIDSVRCTGGTSVVDVSFDKNVSDNLFNGFMYLEYDNNAKKFYQHGLDD